MERAADTATRVRRREGCEVEGVMSYAGMAVGALDAFYQGLRRTWQGGCTTVWATERSSARRRDLLVVTVVVIAALVAQPSRRSPMLHPQVLAPPKPRPSVLPWPPRLARDVDGVGPPRAFFATGSAATSSSESSASAAGLIWMRFRRRPGWALIRRPTSRPHCRPSGGGWRWTHAAFGGPGRQREGKVTTCCRESPK